MVNRLITQGKKLFLSEQTSILSAAFVIMAMVIVSQVLGFLRYRFLIHYFVPDDTTLFLAAFRLPDLIFEVLVFGTFSSAFIPVFTKLIKGGNGEAWNTATRVTNIGLTLFLPLAIILAIFAEPLYGRILPTFSLEQVRTIAQIARVLFVAQLFFIVSFVLTGVLESLRRFLIPALAPIFYNLGIIFGTVFLAPRIGLWGPTVGVIIGAIAHFSIQLPLAYKLGFRFKPLFGFTEPVKKIGRLSLPRLIEVSFLQVAKVVELSLSSLISTAAYTYISLANTIQLIPVRLLGISIAKAALPTLARQDEDLEQFKTTLTTTLNQVIFMVLPLTTLLIVLRIPVIRLAFGTDLFDWESTLQTSYALTAFAVSIPFSASLALLNRAFYALHDTRTPVAVSIAGSVFAISASVILVTGYHFPSWGLAMAYSLGVIIQGIVLIVLLSKKLHNSSLFWKLTPVAKSLGASVVSGGVMFFLIRFFDRSVWVKRLSFLTDIKILDSLNFERFVLDTRYTLNLAILTFCVALIGMGVYILVSWILRSRELATVVRIIIKRQVVPPPNKEMLTNPPDTPPLGS